MKPLSKEASAALNALNAADPTPEDEARVRKNVERALGVAIPVAGVGAATTATTAKAATGLLSTMGVGAKVVVFVAVTSVTATAVVTLSSRRGGERKQPAPTHVAAVAPREPKLAVAVAPAVTPEVVQAPPVSLEVKLTELEGTPASAATVEAVLATPPPARQPTAPASRAAVAPPPSASKPAAPATSQPSASPPPPSESLPGARATAQPSAPPPPSESQPATSPPPPPPSSLQPATSPPSAAQPAVAAAVPETWNLEVEANFPNCDTATELRSAQSARALLYAERAEDALWLLSAYQRRCPSGRWSNDAWSVRIAGLCKLNRTAEGISLLQWFSAEYPTRREPVLAELRRFCSEDVLERAEP